MIKPDDNEFVEHDDQDGVDDIPHMDVAFFEVGHEQQADLDQCHDKDRVDEELRQELIDGCADVCEEVIAGFEDTKDKGDTDENQQDVDDDSYEGADVDADC